MPEVTVPHAFQLAWQHHQAGRLAEAEAHCRQLLGVQPDHADARHLLGVIAHQTGRHELAVEEIGRSLAIQPKNPSALSNLGEAYRAEGSLEKAAAAYGRALALDSEFPEAHHNLANAYCALGRFEEAIAAYRRTLALRPDWAEAHLNLGIALRRQGLPADAATAYRRALDLRADWPEAFNNLGNALRDQGRLADAAAAYGRAVALKPEYPEAHSNLGATLADQGQIEEAIAACQRALVLQPGYPEAHINLANALTMQDRLDEAVAAYRRALELQPDHPKAHLNLGNVLKAQGHLDEALAAYRRAIELQPGDAGAQSNLIYALHNHPAGDRRMISGEQERWNRRFSDPIRRCIRPHLNDRRPERRLRIGYVSPDLRDHVVGRNLIPLFRRHDHRDFEIVGYSGVIRPDGVTGELRQHTDGWRSTAGVNDERLDDVIREDGVDILVDLSQHTGENRLPLFARCPAPVQVSFAGYPESAGVEGIGYRISDRWLESEMGSGECGMRNAECGAGNAECGVRNAEFGWKRAMQADSSAERAVSQPKGRAERVFLIDSFWCYDPCGVEMGVSALPARENGQVTFGSLNNFCKINEPVLRLWAKVLREVKDSRLILLSAPGSHRERTWEFLQGEGIAKCRVKFESPGPRRAYLEQYHRLDLVLDTFPYNGHTTSLDALWMGVPVVSLAGEPAVSRAGLSQLSNLGLSELAAFSEEDFVRIAVELAHDLPRLAELRATMRSRMEASVLMDAPRFARQIEAAYRTMWRQWCMEGRDP